ncbi:MAG: FapA family protein, partial [Azonexus sp.]|nr:FapA family protein [Azonexus sp.]
MEPTTPQALTFSLIEQTGEIEARFDPATGGLPPEPEALLQAFSERGWGDFAIDAAAVSAFATSCRHASQPVVSVLGRRRDGEFSLTLDQDMMTARLTLIPPQGGQAVQLAAVTEALRERGVTCGVLPDAIAAAFADGTCLSMVIARGEPVIEGRPTRFENLFDQRQNQNREDELGRKHYADFSFLQLV